MNPTAQSDRELVDAFLQHRDEETFLVLYRRHAPALFGLIRRELGGDSGRADDVFQEAWVRAVRLLPDFRWESQFRTWLLGIAFNCCSEARRGDRRTDPMEEHHEPAGFSDPGKRMDMEKALAALAPGYRSIVIMHDVYGFTHGEIGNALGINEGTSRSQLSRGRDILRKWIGERT